MVCSVKATVEPFTAIVMIGDPFADAGTIACRPLAPAPTAIENDSRLLPFQVIALNDEPLRPSSHSSICRAVITGTDRACADARIASEPVWPSDGLKSVCMLAVKAP